MLCPFCLNNVRFTKEEGAIAVTYACPQCNEPVPRTYVEDHRKNLPALVSVVGFRGHGKTVSIASLFYTLKHLDVSHYWEKFFALQLNENSLDIVYENVDMLKGGVLPNASPKIFPKPTMIQLRGIPFLPSSIVSFYDTSGESFVRASQVERYATYVSRARVVLFLLSIPMIRDSDLEPAPEMEKLLSVYLQAMGDLGNTHVQNIVIVYTCADALRPMLKEWPDIEQYLLDGSIDHLADQENYMSQMHHLSTQLRAFTKQVLGANQFVNMAESNFDTVHFSIISALGAAPDGKKLSAQIVPRRILDPLLWTLDLSLQGWRKALRIWQTQT